jgi:hypothetical protein
MLSIFIYSVARNVEGLAFFIYSVGGPAGRARRPGGLAGGLYVAREGVPGQRALTAECRAGHFPGGEGDGSPPQLRSIQCDCDLFNAIADCGGFCNPLPQLVTAAIAADSMRVNHPRIRSRREACH